MGEGDEEIREIIIEGGVVRLRNIKNQSMSRPLEQLMFIELSESREQLVIM